MNEEPLKFIPGDTEQVLGGIDGEPGTYEACIHVVGSEVWLKRICVYGYEREGAEGLRDRLLWALAQPTVPAQWQFKRREPDGYDADELPAYKEVWVNLDNGGEAARLKGEGYEIRALYAKQPLKEV